MYENRFLLLWRLSVEGVPVMFSMTLQTARLYFEDSLSVEKRT